MTTNRSGLAACALPMDSVVSFKDGCRPVASTLPETMRVFMSTRRETYVMVEGSTRPTLIATIALEVVK